MTDRYSTMVCIGIGCRDAERKPPFVRMIQFLLPNGGGTGVPELDDQAVSAAPARMGGRGQGTGQGSSLVR
jgi:hypothetical protein